MNNPARTVELKAGEKCPICKSGTIQEVGPPINDIYCNTKGCDGPFEHGAAFLQEADMAVFMINGQAYTLRGKGAETVWEYMKGLEAQVKQSQEETLRREGKHG